MRKILLCLTAVSLFVACSAPKYTYYFDYYDYNSGKKKETAGELATVAEGKAEHVVVALPESLLAIDERALTASAGEPVPVITPAPATSTAVTPVIKDFSGMSKKEQKAFKKELRKEIKNQIKNSQEGQTVKATQEMDHRLRSALIFGGAGLFLCLIAPEGTLMILGVVGVVLALMYFFIWLIDVDQLPLGTPQDDEYYYY